MADPIKVKIKALNEATTVDNADLVIIERGIEGGETLRATKANFIKELQSDVDALEVSNAGLQSALGDKVDGTVRITVSSSEPQNPNEGDLWIDIS